MSSGKIETRQAILEAALQLFTQGDPSAVRMVDIAKIAGVTRQAVYLHFGSRTGLLVSLVQYVDEKEGLAALAQPVWDAATGVEALDRFVTLQAEYNPRIYSTAKIGISGRYGDDAVAAAWEDRMAGRREACRGLILWLERDGVLAPFDSLEEAADLLWTLTSIQVWEQLVIDQGWTAEQYDQYLRTVMRNVFVAG